MTLAEAQAFMESWITHDRYIINLMMGITTFAIALAHRHEDFYAPMRQPLRMVAMLVGPALVCPLLTFYLTGAIQDRIETTTSITIIALCPTFGVALYLTWLAAGRVSIAFWVITISMLAAALLFPTYITIWLAFNPGAGEMLPPSWFDPWELIRPLVYCHLIPGVIGNLIGRHSSRGAWKVGAVLAHASFLLTTGFWLFLMARVSPIVVQFFWTEGIATLGLMVFAGAAAFGLSMLIGLRPREAVASIFLTATKFTVFSNLITFLSYPLDSGVAVASIWWTFHQYAFGIGVAYFIKRTFEKLF